MYGDAIAEYTKAIEKLSSGDCDVTMNKSAAALHSNRALCYLQVIKIVSNKNNDKNLHLLTTINLLSAFSKCFFNLNKLNLNFFKLGLVTICNK